MNAICPDCGGPGVQLLTSIACDACDPVEAPTKPGHTPAELELPFPDPGTWRILSGSIMPHTTTHYPGRQGSFDPRLCQHPELYNYDGIWWCRSCGKRHLDPGQDDGA